MAHLGPPLLRFVRRGLPSEGLRVDPCQTEKETAGGAPPAPQAALAAAQVLQLLGKERGEIR